jgi:hypothetical protein
MFTINMTVLVAGLINFIYFFDCDPVQAEKVQNRNQVTSFWIIDTLTKVVPSLAGICLSAIVTFSVVHYSNGICSCSNSLFDDFLLPSMFNKHLKWCKKSTIDILKIFTNSLFIVGTVGFSILLHNVPNTIFSLFNIFNDSLNSPIAGLFTLAMFNPYSNHVGAMLAFLIALIKNIWLTIGSLTVVLKTQELPTNIFNCNGTSLDMDTLLNGTALEELAQFRFNQTAMLPNDGDSMNPVLFYLYSMSSIWYCLFDFVFIIVAGSVFSLIWSLVSTRTLDADSHYKEERQKYLFNFRKHLSLTS